MVTPTVSRTFALALTPTLARTLTLIPDPGPGPNSGAFELLLWTAGTGFSTLFVAIFYVLVFIRGGAGGHVAIRINPGDPAGAAASINSVGGRLLRVGQAVLGCGVVVALLLTFQQGCWWFFAGRHARRAKEALKRQRSV